MNLEENKLVRIEGINFKLSESPDHLKSKIASILGVSKSKILSYQVVKRAIDSRDKENIIFVYSVDVEIKNHRAIKKWGSRHRVRLHTPFVYELNSVNKEAPIRPVVIGTGPCGLFASLLLARAGLKPLVIERGRDMDARVEDVQKFLEDGKLNTESNVQFGEGGAGTFSDGKLYTLINDPRSKYIFDELIEAGAPEEIAWSATPHIGTDRLREVVKELRNKIIKLGGEIRFETCLTDIEVENNQIKFIILNNKEKIEVSEVILAIGHSARDTYQMLYEKDLKISAKPFSMGVRIEHKAEMINNAQYGEFFNHEKLGAAKYKLAVHPIDSRAVYTFCMCPGGYVMAAASEEGGVVTNGMSEYDQDGDNSNSALMVSVTPEDFGSDHPLAGIEFQRTWERKAFEAGGGDYKAPAQLVGDFLAGQVSKKIGHVQSSYRRGITLTSLDDCLPEYIAKSLRAALPMMDKKIKGFAHPEAVLTGVESRSSSPVRLLRNESCESSICGLYPAGEGAGYAGGIVSSAIDGLTVAEAIISKYL